jgi:outer membrane protein OmpA-like peptidoglycan-associated protein
VIRSSSPWHGARYLKSPFARDVRRFRHSSRCGFNQECPMKLVHLSGSVAVLLLAACGAGSRQASTPEQAAREAADEKHEAQEEAQDSKKDAEQARLKAAEATRAQHEAEQNARFAAQREAEANAQATQAEYAGGPRKPVTQTEYATSHKGAAELQPGTTEHELGRSTVSFGANSAELSPAAKIKLDEIAANFRANPQGRSVIVEGYSADFGEEATSAQLARRRGDEVANYLESKGVPRERMGVKALGAQNPVSTEKTERGQALNRRVDVVIMTVRK